MSTDYGFSFSVGKILESSNISSLQEQYSPYRSVETTSKLNFMSMRKNSSGSGASNKTRKSRSSQTRTMKTTTLTDDGYGWRKYGQKKINNDPHPKSYYRCTHHTEEKCEAKKWVQQESEDPPIYKITYLGSHSCQNPLKIPQILLPYATSSSGYSASSSDDFIAGSFDLDDHSSSASKPVFLCFDSPTSNSIIGSNITGQMSFASSSSSSSSSTHQPADLMMFSEESAITDQCCINMEESINYEIGAYENGTVTEEELCDFPPMGSPSCNFGSYDFNLMMGDYSPDLDSVMNYILT